jgi:hypothetical protein
VIFILRLRPRAHHENLPEWRGRPTSVTDD